MKDFTRRNSLKVGAGLIAGATVGTKLRPAFAQEPTFDLKPEAGATLRVLRPAKFVAGDEKLWLENTEKYHQGDRRAGQGGEPGLGGSASRSRRSPPMSARVRMSSMAGTTTPISIRTSWSISPISASISIRSTAAGTTCARSSACGTASGSPFRWAPPARASSIASPRSRKPASTPGRPISPAC